MKTSVKIGILLLLGFVYLIIDTLYKAGSFKTINNHLVGKVEKTLRGVWGPEDMEWDRAQGLLYISSLNRRKFLAGNPQQSDGIYLLKTRLANSEPTLMQTDLSTGFHPHGISVFAYHGKQYLYAVNHLKSTHTVELFEIQGAFLKHRHTYQNKWLSSPNDVAGDEPGKFYVTNDHGNTSALGRTLEDYLRLPNSYLLYYDGGQFVKVWEDLGYANGVHLSNDGSEVYVTATVGLQLLVLEKYTGNGELVLQRKIDLNTGADNVDVDAKGRIWITAHPKLFAFVAHAKDASKTAPSQVLMLDPEKNYTITREFEDDGSKISAASIMVVHNDTAFVGCVFQDKILKVVFEQPLEK